MVVIFLIPGPSESPAPPCRASNIDFAFKQVSCIPIQYIIIIIIILMLFWEFVFKSYIRNFGHVRLRSQGT